MAGLATGAGSNCVGPVRPPSGIMITAWGDMERPVTLLFIDTEFTSLQAPELISVAR